MFSNRATYVLVRICSICNVVFPGCCAQLFASAGYLHCQHLPQKVWSFMSPLPFLFQAQACLLLHKVLLLRELKLFMTEEEWEELIRESISQVTEVTSFNMLNVQIAPNGCCFYQCGACSQLESAAVLALTDLRGVVLVCTRSEQCPPGLQRSYNTTVQMCFHRVQEMCLVQLSGACV